MYLIAMFNTRQSTSDFDSGVSPVIGVILMVAITVILAAVIGTFVLDLAGNLNQSASASVTFEQSPSGQIDTTNDGNNNPDTQTFTVDIQAVSFQNADSVEISASDNDNTQQDTTTGNSTDGLSAYDPSVGTTSLTGVGDTSTVSQLTAGDSITATGVLQGDQTVLQTYEVSG